MSARHRQMKRHIAELRALCEDIETRRIAYAIVCADMPESEVVAHVMIAMRKLELDADLGCASSELRNAKEALAAMPKRKETARV